jgi:hypothetical protein
MRTEVNGAPVNEYRRMIEGILVSAIEFYVTPRLSRLRFILALVMRVGIMRFTMIVKSINYENSQQRNWISTCFSHRSRIQCIVPASLSSEQTTAVHASPLETLYTQRYVLHPVSNVD